MRGRVVYLLFLIWCLSTSIIQAAQSLDQVVRQTVNDVINRIESKRPALESDPSQVYSLVNDLVVPHFDFVSMSRWVLGKNWKAASEAQRDDFIEQFKTLLVRTYARALLEHSSQDIIYFPAVQKPDSRLAVVKTELIKAGAQPLPVVYRMHQKDAVWKVVDVAVDGVSLVSTYRGSFSVLIRKNGFDSLIRELTAKNKKLARKLSS